MKIEKSDYEKEIEKEAKAEVEKKMERATAHAIEVVKSRAELLRMEDEMRSFSEETRDVNNVSLALMFLVLTDPDFADAIRDSFVPRYIEKYVEDDAEENA